MKEYEIMDIISNANDSFDFKNDNIAFIYEGISIILLIK